jgi:hypothetical protein
MGNYILRDIYFVLFAYGDIDFVTLCFRVHKILYQTPHATYLQFSILIFVVKFFPFVLSTQIVIESQFFTLLKTFQYLFCYSIKV